MKIEQPFTAALKVMTTAKWKNEIQTLSSLQRCLVANPFDVSESAPQEVTSDCLYIFDTVPWPFEH